jgi:hypothetical protein
VQEFVIEAKVRQLELLHREQQTPELAQIFLTGIDSFNIPWILERRGKGNRYFKIRLLIKPFCGMHKFCDV